MIEPNSRVWWGLLVVCTAVLLWLLHAELILTSTIPASYDLTGHILPIAELKQRLLPQGRVHGWSADWFAGFPLYYFYFPLPALIAAAFSLVMSLEAAVKVTSALGMLAFPFALHVLFRALVLPRRQAAIAAAVSSTFLLMQSFWFLGGNIASTVAGEFAYSISLTLSLLYVATLLRASSRLTSFVVPALLLAGVALSHLVTTIAIVGVSALLLRDPNKRRIVLLSWIAAFLLSAFWTVPFILRHGEMAAVYAHATRSFSEVMPLEMWPVLVGALAGAVVAWHYPPARVLLYITASGILFYFIGGKLVYPGRFLPFWYLGAHMLAGFAVASAVRGLGRTKTIILIAVTVLPLVLLNAVRGVGYLREWSGSAYGGLEKRDSWRELQPLFAALENGEGRIYWEQAPQQLSALGSRNLASVTPYIARGQQVVNGLWLESSQLHDELIAVDSAIARARYDGRQLDVALGKMSELGVTRFIALTPATAQLLMQRGAPVQATSQSFAVFAVPAKPLIESRTSDVQILEWSDERVRFRTTSPGAPHVVRMSWFPNWRAYGGSLERGQNGMMLVMPRQNEVELRFERTFVELVGAIISIVAALAFAVTVLSGRRRDLRQAPD